MTHFGQDRFSKLRSELLTHSGFTGLDAHVGSLCASADEGDQSARVLFYAAASVSRALRDGHPCLQVSELGGLSLFREEDPESASDPSFVFPTRDRLVDILAHSPAVLQLPLGSDDELIPAAPLVFDGNDRLYAARFFDHERRLAVNLASLLRDAGPDRPEPQWLLARLDHYFPEGAARRGIDLQKEAARAATEQRLCVVSGGPGTGKTSTVVKILALLCELSLVSRSVLPRILLMAPTGKAASRLNESVAQAVERLNLTEELKSAIVPNATTIHRALGVRPDSATRYVHSRSYPFSADIVLIDEGSMVDLSLMRHVSDALAESARLIVLGDRYQLASVEAGSVFSEICSALSLHRSPSLTELEISYRFAPDSGIAALSEAIRNGDSDSVATLGRESRSDIFFHSSVEEEESAETLFSLAINHWERAFSASTAGEALLEFSRFRVLSAHRRGRSGVEHLNSMIAQRLFERGKIPSALQLSRGHLLMVLENDPALKLSNGDVGVCWPDDHGRLYVCFFAEDGSVRKISPPQMPAHEVCYVMTIHKSQGSEYDTVALVLPPESSKILSRELFYTGVTRAKKTAHVFSDAASLERAVENQVIRRSGLATALRARLTKPAS